MDPAVIGGSSEWPMKGRTLPIKNAFEFVLIMVPLSKTKKIAHSNNLFLPLVIAGLTNPDPLTRTLFRTLPLNAHLVIFAFHDFYHGAMFRLSRGVRSPEEAVVALLT